MPMDRHRATNRAMWDEAVPVHMAAPGYSVQKFLDGQTVLHQRDIDEMGDVQGQSLLHLQCHFGLDTLSWARLGARVTGVDFSEPAIAAARDLAAQANLEATFVLSELYDAPENVEGQFDIVYTGIGALNWLPDIKGWARVAAGFMRPGGRFYLVEGHPMLWSLDDEREDGGLVVSATYFETEKPNRWEGGADYADPKHSLENNLTFEWNHGLGEIVTALIEAGLSIEWVHEHRSVYWKALPHMISASGEDRWEVKDEWRLPDDQGDNVPLMYSISAVLPDRGVAPP